MSDERPKQLGIAIRFIKGFDINETLRPPSWQCASDRAMMLAMQDRREGLTFGQKLIDALTFVREQYEAETKP